MQRMMEDGSIPPIGTVLLQPDQRGFVPLVLGTYCLLRRMLERRYLCSHAALINATCTSLEVLQIPYGEPL